MTQFTVSEWDDDAEDFEETAESLGTIEDVIARINAKDNAQNTTQNLIDAPE